MRPSNLHIDKYMLILNTLGEHFELSCFDY